MYMTELLENLNEAKTNYIKKIRNVPKKRHQKAVEIEFEF